MSSPTESNGPVIHNYNAAGELVSVQKIVDGKTYTITMPVTDAAITTSKTVSAIIPS